MSAWRCLYSFSRAAGQFVALDHIESLNFAVKCAGSGYIQSPICPQLNFFTSISGFSIKLIAIEPNAGIRFLAALVISYEL